MLEFLLYSSGFQSGRYRRPPVGDMNFQRGSSE